MDRIQQPWTSAEDAFLRCPIPARFLAKGALSGRTVESIRWRRRRNRSLRIARPAQFARSFASWGKAGPPRADSPSDYPDCDWDQSIRSIQRSLGVTYRTAWRLRAEARKAQEEGKPFRSGRRKYSYRDFPGIDWSAPTRTIMRRINLSRVVVYRLVRDAGFDPAKWKSQNQSRKSETPKPISKK